MKLSIFLSALILLLLFLLKPTSVFACTPGDVCGTSQKTCPINNNPASGGVCANSTSYCYSYDTGTGEGGTCGDNNGWNCDCGGYIEEYNDCGSCPAPLPPSCTCDSTTAASLCPFQTFTDSCGNSGACSGIKNCSPSVDQCANLNCQADIGETCFTCPADCGKCNATTTCSDKICPAGTTNAGKSYQTCCDSSTQQCYDSPSCNSTTQTDACTSNASCPDQTAHCENGSTCGQVVCAPGGNCLSSCPTDCNAPKCNYNQVQDNGETGKDCGGGGCPACPTSGTGGTGGTAPPPVTSDNCGAINFTFNNQSSVTSGWLIANTQGTMSVNQNGIVQYLSSYSNYVCSNNLAGLFRIGIGLSPFAQNSTEGTYATVHCDANIQSCSYCPSYSGCNSGFPSRYDGFYSDVSDVTSNSNFNFTNLQTTGITAGDQYVSYFVDKGCWQSSQYVFSHICTAQAVINVFNSFDYYLSNTGNITVEQGQSGQTTIGVNFLSGTARNVVLAVDSSQVPGVTNSLSTTQCIPTCQSTLTLNIPGDTPLGTYTVTVLGMVPDYPTPLQRTTTFSLRVGAGPPCIKTTGDVHSNTSINSQGCI